MTEVMSSSGEQRNMPSDSGATHPEFEPWIPPAVEPEHRRFLTDDGVGLNYVEWPSEPGAPVLIMVHGRRAHSRWFDPVAMELSPRYRCVGIDMRGHGESDSSGEPSGFERHAADLAQFFNLSDGQKRIILAHSMAGRIVLMAHGLYHLQPDLLVLADTPLTRRPHHMKPEPPFRNKNYPSRQEAALRFRLMPAGTSAHPDLLRYIAEHAIRENEDGTWSWKFDDAGTNRPPGMQIPDWHEIPMESITCPTLVIYGEHSALLDAEDGQAIAGRFPKGKAVCLPGSYHHLMLDQPKGFNKILLDFFGQNGL